VWQPDFRALRLPMGAPPLGLARSRAGGEAFAAEALAILPRLRGRCRAQRGGGGSNTGPPSVSPLRGEPPPPQAGEDKPLCSLQKPPEVVFGKIEGGGPPSSGRRGNSGRPSAKRPGSGAPRAARSRAMALPVAAMALEMRMKCQIQAERRRGSGAANARSQQAFDRVSCARRCSSRARVRSSALIRLSGKSESSRGQS